MSVFTKPRKIAELKVPLLSVHEWPCADCGGKLKLVLENNQPSYKCERRYTRGCLGTAIANPDGTIASIPIDAHGRDLRKILHALVDVYWLNEHNKSEARIAVYKFMYEQLGPIEVKHPNGQVNILQEFHVGWMLHKDLRAAIQIAQSQLRKEFRHAKKGDG